MINEINATGERRCIFQIEHNPELFERFKQKEKGIEDGFDWEPYATQGIVRKTTEQLGCEAEQVGRTEIAVPYSHLKHAIAWFGMYQYNGSLLSVKLIEGCSTDADWDD